MSRRDDLIALRDAVRAGDFVKFRIIAKVLASESRDIGKTWPSHDAQKAMSGSVDAALAFFAAVLPEWTVNGLTQLRHPDNGMKPTGQWDCLMFAAFESRFAHSSAQAETPARALLLATLNALIAESDT